MAAAFPTSVVTDAVLGLVLNGAQTALNGGINNSVTTITVTDTTSFPTAGYFVIDSEVIQYTGKTSVTFTGCTRGSDSSAAASHLTAAVVSGFVVAANITNMQLEIKAIEADISARFGIGASSNAIAVPVGVTFNIGANNLMVDQVNHRVGIGGVTAVPDSTLHLRTDDTNDLIVHVHHNNATGDPAVLYATNGQAWIAGIDNSDSDRYKISIGSSLGTSDALQIDTSGNFGLGTITASINPDATSGLAVTMGGAVSGTSVTILSLRGNRTGADSQYIGIQGWHGTTKTSQIYALRGSADDEGYWKIQAKKTGVAIGDVATFKWSGCAILGTTTNDSAAAGYVGEYIESLGSGSVNGVNNTFVNFTSISLTAGDWDVTGLCRLNNSGATVTTAQVAVSVNSGNTATDHVSCENLVITTYTFATADDVPGTMVPCYRLSLSTTTTVYLKFRFNFSAGTPACLAGRISARRMR